MSTDFANKSHDNAVIDSAINPVVTLAIVLLAGGASRRFNGVKLESVLDGGESLLHKSVSSLLTVKNALYAGALSTASNTSSVTVILGANSERLIPLLPEGVTWLVNPNWEQGIGTSVALAALHANALGADALLLSLGDQVALTSVDYLALIQGFISTKQTSAAFYRQKPGVPAIFLAEDFNGLSLLEGDSGAKAILKEHNKNNKLTLIPLNRAAIDIDTQADLSNWLANKE
jgi:molybdenum cofactor cytidylyltransferase